MEASGTGKPIGEITILKNLGFDFVISIYTMCATSSTLHRETRCTVKRREVHYSLKYIAPWNTLHCETLWSASHSGIYCTVKCIAPWNTCHCETLWNTVKHVTPWNALHRETYCTLKHCEAHHTAKHIALCNTEKHIAPWNTLHSETHHTLKHCEGHFTLKHSEAHYSVKHRATQRVHCETQRVCVSFFSISFIDIKRTKSKKSYVACVCCVHGVYILWPVMTII